MQSRVALLRAKTRRQDFFSGWEGDRWLVGWLVGWLVDWLEKGPGLVPYGAVNSLKLISIALLVEMI